MPINILIDQIACPAARRRLRHHVNYVKAIPECVTMTRTELISAPASRTHCVFQTFFFDLASKF